MAHSDQYLIERFREGGSRDVLEELLRRHLSRTRGVVYQMLLDHDAADDVTQDIFVRVIRGIEKFEGRSEFSTWLYQIAMNTVRTYLKRRGRSPVRFHDELPEGTAVSRVAPDGAVLQAELTSDVQTALTSLSPQLRAAIVLVCLQGQSASDAAEIEGCSTDTMYWRVHEARRQMKQLLAEHLS